jgi:hypothetical protein
VDIRIDPEFQSLLPPLSSDERKCLRENIERDGCREPLTVWEEEGILLDGHNRLAVCKELGIEPAVIEVNLPGREAAKVWIALNGAGRRNLKQEARDNLVRYAVGKKYLLEKKPKSGRPKKVADLPHIPPQRTEQTVAVEFGVSPRTVRDNATFADAVDKIGEVSPSLKQQALHGKISQSDVIALSKDEEKLKQAVVEGATLPELVAEMAKNPEIRWHFQLRHAIHEAAKLIRDNPHGATPAQLAEQWWKEAAKSGIHNPREDYNIDPLAEFCRAYTAFERKVSVFVDNLVPVRR